MSNNMTQEKERLKNKNRVKRMDLHLGFFRLIISGILFFILNSCENKNEPVIELWYGDEQFFGNPGNTQPFINILGNISASSGISKCSYSINDGPMDSFTLGSDLHRLAAPGDFNIEFKRELLNPGINHILIEAWDSLENKSRKMIRIHYSKDKKWPIPYGISWDTVKNIQDVVHVSDGKWVITAEGVRVLDPYYDRVLAFGDSSWINYEVTAEVTFHSYVKPEKGKGAPFFNVTHAAIASRWIGFDPDKYNPHRKWFPLGATCEFRLTPDLDSCSYRILVGGRRGAYQAEMSHTIELNREYLLKTSTSTIGIDSALFRAKFWQVGLAEPVTWDISYIKSPEEVKSGCALLIAHHTEVTFGKIQVNPL